MPTRDWFEPPASVRPPLALVPPPLPGTGFTPYGPGDRLDTAAGVPIVPGVPDQTYDGALVGGDGRVYPAGTRIGDIPPVNPKPPGDGRNGLIIFVNGVGGDIATQQRYMQDTANTANARVIGLHNATSGKLGDVAQAAGDKLWANNPATNGLAQTIITELDNGAPVHLAGHSQGALITSGALRQVEAHYLSLGYTPEQVKQKLAAVSVETFGGAGTTYPNGPRYVHFVNQADPVSALFGVIEGVGAGEGARLITFRDFNGYQWGRWPRPLDPHSYTDVYLPQRQRAGATFDEIYGDR